MPRKRSTKTVAEQPQREERRARGWSAPGRRPGRRPGPRSRRCTKSLTSSQKPSRTSGKESLKTSQVKNVSRTSGQPGLVRIQAARPPRTTTVETAAIACAAPRLAALRRLAFEAAVADDGGLGHAAADLTRRDGPRRAPALVQFGGAGGLAHPALGDLASSPELSQRFDRLGDAGGQRRALGQQGAPLVAAGGGELADDGRASGPGPRSGRARSAGRRRRRRSVRSSAP